MSRHRFGPSDTLWVEDGGWRLVESGWDDDRAVAVGSNFMVGNGYLGFRGTSPEQVAEDYVALVVTDTYDCADGRWRELTTAPNLLFVRARVDGVPLEMRSGNEVTNQLDLRTGSFGGRFRQAIGDAAVTMTVERFASYDHLHLPAQRLTVVADRDVSVEIEAGLDGDVWSLNGVHLPSLDFAGHGELLTVTGTTGESGVEIAVASASTVSGAAVSTQPDKVTARQWFKRYHVELTAGTELITETVAAVARSNDGIGPHGAVVEAVESNRGCGYQELLADTRRQWDRIRRDCDVTIEGNPADQAALRFSTYQNRICTPAHSDHLPVGARGLSCQAYQGAAFWDQEIYNLPAFLFTEPDISRALLVYHHRTLDGARRKAERLGYGMLAARIGDIGAAAKHFRETATVDLLNTQHPVVGGTFIGGVHTAACGGTYQLAVHGFGGLDFRHERLVVDPLLPPDWGRLSYPVRWRGLSLVVTITDDRVEIEADAGNRYSVEIEVRGRSVTVVPGGTVTVTDPG